MKEKRKKKERKQKKDGEITPGKILYNLVRYTSGSRAERDTAEEVREGGETEREKEGVSEVSGRECVTEKERGIGEGRGGEKSENNE